MHIITSVRPCNLLGFGRRAESHSKGEDFKEDLELFSVLFSAVVHARRHASEGTPPPLGTNKADLKVFEALGNRNQQKSLK